MGAVYLVRTLASRRRHFSWLSGVSRFQASAIACASGEDGVAEADWDRGEDDGPWALFVIWLMIDQMKERWLLEFEF